MTAKEHKTYDELIKLIVTQNNASKVLLDMLKLISSMKAAYSKKES